MLANTYLYSSDIVLTNFTENGKFIFRKKIGK